MGCQNVLVLISSSRRRCKLPFWCPLVDLFLRGVAKLKNLQDEVLYVLVIHLEASIISVVGSCLVFLAIKPILSSHEATFKNAINDSC